jgi:hypothetical protein
MRRILLFTLLTVPLLAQAQQAAVEITPFAGYRFGGTFETEDETARYEMEDSASFGLIVNLPHKINTQWEILYSQQGSAEALYEGDPGPDPLVDVDIHVLQIGGTYLFEGEKAIPYLAATIGGTHIRTSSGESRDDTFFSGSIGIGMKFLPTSRVGIRVEARAYGTLVSSNSELFCSTGPDANFCAVQIDGKLFSQVETFAGITFRF